MSHGQTTDDAGRFGRRGRTPWRSATGHLVCGAAIGAAALYVSLATMLLGFAPMAFLAWWVWRDAGPHRLTFVGGVMIGIGLCAWPTLGAAVTNTDPAVQYDPSTIPVLVAALVVGAMGLPLVVLGVVRTGRRDPA